MMVTKTVGYYRAAFKGGQGVTQEDSISPKLFNMVMYAVVSHWVAVIVEGA